jgi:hypothetical protein
MTADLSELLAEIQHHSALAVRSTKRVMELVQTLADAPGVATSSGRLSHPSRTQVPTSYLRWVGWLKENGPAPRQEVADGANTPLTKRAMELVTNWIPLCEAVEDGTYTDDDLFRVDEQPNGAGRPRAIYFLWGQRYEVRPLFGVGPERPDAETDTETDAETGTEPETLLGVVLPPEPDTGEPLFAQEYPEPETEPEPEPETQSIGDPLGDLDWGEI